ncbi:FxsA family protein [Nocardiopsis mangrovi]|uniref:FxsA family protein n=1 Tax=Nocardiopsis mangrovi TaxID=1179818 RepID=A0ABV9E307_9ACTN
MPLLIVLSLMAMPFIEIWLMVLVGQQIGPAWTIVALFALSASGILVVRRAGMKAFREADAAMRTGQQPKQGVLDTVMLMVGGILLIIPGFLTGALGALMALPVTRPLLRWAFSGWAERRVKRMRERAEREFATIGVHVPGQAPGDGPPRAGSGKVIRGHIVDDGPADPAAR